MSYTLPRFARDFAIMHTPTKSRCAVAFDAFDLPVSDNTADNIVQSLGFRRLDVDMIVVLRQLIGSSMHRRGALPSEAPGVIDCSLLAWWAYQQVGIELPRYTINQRAVSVKVTGKVRPGDLLFRSGYQPYFQSNPDDGVGHVGVATSEGMVIHAPSKQTGVIEEPIEAFVGDGTRFRGVGRIIPSTARIVTYAIPANVHLASTLDLRCLILQHL